jgi:hypothetical protein
MARQDIYLGVEGNDGTGDSIREAFRKANANFTELYAVFGQGGSITFKALSDTPDVLTPSPPGAAFILGTNQTGTEIIERQLQAGTGITVDSSQEGRIIINNVGANVSADTAPVLGGHLSGNIVYGIGQIATDETAVSQFNTTHGTTITQDDLVIDKKFADQHYGVNGLFEERAGYVRSEPANGSEYTKTITEYRNGNVEVIGHGLNSGANGSPFKYTATDTVPTNLVADTIYYVRFVDEDFLSLHPTKEEAQNNDDTTRVKVNINNGDTIVPIGTDSIVDNEYDTELLGFWKNNEALPRESITRRQGDRMTGPLYLHDHPGDLAGTDTGLTDDLQAATKFYVDNTSFASDVDLYVSTSGDDSQTNSPVGKEGRSLNYAYKSLGAAAQKAQEIIEASPLEPGAYIQTITYDQGAGNSITNFVGVTTPYADATPAIDIITLNKKFITKEVLAFIKATYPDLEYADTNVINPIAEAMLHENKRFLQEETIAWINDQIDAGAGIWNSFIYNSDKCKRDVGKIVDAMVHDIGRGGNIETRRMASSYWTNGETRVYGQEQQTVAALNYTRDIILNNILTSVAATPLQDPITNPQRIFTETVESGLTARVTELFGIITDVIENGLEQLPGPINTTKSGNTCERDVEAIINGLLIDIGNGVNVNFHAIQAGVRYYSSPSSAKARITQGTQTVAAIDEINNVIAQVVLQNNVTERQTLFAQVLDSNIAQPSLTVRNSISAKFDIITTIIQNGPSSKPGLVEGSTYTIQFTNGSEDSVDQGVNTNVDILPGKVVRGKTSGAIGRIVKYTSGVDLGGTAYDKVEVVLQEAKPFELGEELEYGNFTRTKQIVINVETGIYYEDYPIKVPANVSIKGSDFRRCIIRPADRISRSPWINTYFYRDKLIDNLAVTARIGNDLATAQEISFSGENDIGGVITVTPADNISPDSWEGAWFYTDNGAEGLITESDVGGSSFLVQLTNNRLPNLSNIPAGQWHIKQTQNYGYHYRTDPSDITSTPKNNKDIDVFLMNDATRLANMTFQGHGGFAQVLDPDGQILIKSPYMQVCGSFSQSINTQAFRGGMYIDAFSGNLEMTINSKTDDFTLNVSSPVGKGLRIRKPETPCPFFINGKRYQVDAVTNYDAEAGTATLLLNSLSNEGLGFDTVISTPIDIFTQTAGNRSMLANDYTQVNDLGYGLFVNNGALSEQVSTFTYYCHTAFMCNNGSIIRALNCSNSNGNYGLVSAGSDPNEEVDVVTSLRPMVQPARAYADSTYSMPLAATSVYVYDVAYPPYNNSLLDVDDGTGVTQYEITNVSVLQGVNANGSKGATLPVYRLTIGGDNGLVAPILNDDILTIRQNKNFLFDSVEPATTIRPSTAIIFDEQPTQVYRTISYNNQDSDNSALPADQSQIVFDSGFDFLNLLLDNTYAIRNDFAGAGTTMGSTPGDRVIAVSRITSNIDIDRINNSDMIFTHDGKTFRVSNYTERTDSSNGDYEYATVVINDVAGSDINVPATSAGLPSSLVIAGSQRTLPLCLPAGENATITIAISTLRANGHDFNDIGSGGFNSSNYPGVIYGPPIQTPSQAAEVQERGKGRVFWVSTDQDGFFRVGKYFEVDQGTGTVTFAASIAISNLDGLGFRRGVRISEFSNDDLLSDSDPQAVPTEYAVDEFINRRLHFQRDGSVVGLNRQLGPGVLARDGSTSMTGDLNAGGNQISNLADPRSDQPQDATTKSYVDGRTPFGDEAIGADKANRTTNDILVFDGTTYDNATPAGDVSISVANNVATFNIAPGAIEDGDIAANAIIAQSKLLLNAATTRIDAVGINQNDLGVASFNSLQFNSTNGWVYIKNNGVGYETLPELPNEYVIGRIGTGAGEAMAVTFADVVNRGGTFTTTGQADSIVKTKSDGGIDGQSLYIDNYKIIDQTANTLNVTTPGGAVIFDSVGTIPSNTTTTFAGSVDIGSVGVAPSTHQKNSSFGSNTDTTLNQSRLAVDWIYSSFIEAPGEKDANGTGIAIGAGTGFSNAGEVAIIANDNQPAITFQQTKFIPYTNGTYDIGSSTNAFGTMYGQATSAQYADLAENYLADDDYEVGTVVAFGGELEVTVTQTKGDHRVAGVVSTNPAHLMNSELKGDNVKPIALQGRVPCKVIGKVEKGDMLVTSAIAGHAIVNNSPGIGQVIGKAVGTKNDEGKGLVEVVVGRV